MRALVEQRGDLPLSPDVVDHSCCDRGVRAYRLATLMYVQGDCRCVAPTFLENPFISQVNSRIPVPLD